MENKPSPFNARSVQYVRPNQPFHCGRRGSPCDHGPTLNGQCGDPQHPCSPTPSEGKTKRKYLTRAMLLTTGLVMIALSRNDLSIIDPGTHSSFHSHLACTSCHEPVEFTSVEFLSRGLMNQEIAHASMKCLDCHDMGEYGADPHSVSPNFLSRLTSGPTDSAPPTPLVSCARCHEEHRPQIGTENLNDSRCQSCHQQRFSSIDDGHPEFSSDYGQPQRSIRFDHLNHAKKHFKEFEDLAPEACDDCHGLGPDRHRMVVKPFALTCSPCHSDSISGNGPTGKNRGIEFLSIPALDTDALSEANLDIGSWPYDGSDFPTAWSLRWIRNQLEDDSDLKKLSGVELYSLADASDEVLGATERVARSFKSALAKGLDSDLNQVIGSFISATLEPDLDQTQFSQLSGQLPRSVLQRASDEWFTSSPEEQVDTIPAPPADDDRLLDDDDLLSDDDDLFSDDDEVPLDREPASPTKNNGVVSPVSIDPEKWASAGGWYFDATSILYRPVQHADPFIRAWATLEAQTNGEDLDSASIFEQVFGPLSAGDCASCHLGVKHDDPQVRWTPDSMRPESYPQSTRFSHGPHVMSGSSTTCLSCHQLERDIDLINDWKAISRNTCIECHGQQVKSGCSTCHEYHMGPSSRLLNSAELHPLLAPQKR